MKSQVIVQPFQGFRRYRIGVSWNEMGRPERTIMSEVLPDNAHPKDIAHALHELAERIVMEND